MPWLGLQPYHLSYSPRRPSKQGWGKAGLAGGPLWKILMLLEASPVIQEVTVSPGRCWTHIMVSCMELSFQIWKASEGWWVIKDLLLKAHTLTPCSPEMPRQSPTPLHHQWGPGGMWFSPFTGCCSIPGLFACSVMSDTSSLQSLLLEMFGISLRSRFSSLVLPSHPCS